MKIGITGASGFVGGTLFNRLRLDHEVWKLVHQKTGRGREILCDLNYPDRISLCGASFDTLIHAAGIVGNATDVPVSQYQTVNVDATRAIYNCVAKAGVNRLILISSGAVYSPSPDELIETSETNPVDNYGKSKRQSEMVAAEFVDSVETVVMRLFFPYGPGQRNARLIPRLIERIVSGEPIPLLGETGPKLSLCFVDDVVNLTQCILDRWQPTTINVAGPESLSIRRIAELLGNLLEIPPRFDLNVGPEGANFLANSELATKLFGYSCDTLVHSGLEKTVLAFRNVGR